MLASLRRLGALKTFNSEPPHPSHMGKYGPGIFVRELPSGTSPVGLQLLEETLGLTKVDGYFAYGFQLNGIQVFGSVLCLRDFWMQWKPSTMEQITPESLAFLKLFKPLPEMLVLGCGEKILEPQPEVRSFLHNEEIALECLNTKNAIPLFNMLNLEGRSVMGAFLPIGISAEEEEQMPVAPPIVRDL